MICPQCQTEVADGAASCPNCGAQFAAAAGPPPAVAAPGAAGATATGGGFKFEMDRLSQADRITSIASFVLLISIFFPWYSYKFVLGTVTQNGFWHFWMWFVFLVCLAIIALVIMKGGLSELPFKLPLPEPQIMLIATVFNLVLTLLAVVLKPGGYGFSGIGWSFGAFVALAAAVVAVVPLALPAMKAKRAG